MDTLQVHKHLGLVTSIAERLVRRLPPTITLEDLISVGGKGLMEAADHYCPNRGVPFPAYAALRVRWAMQDFLRSQDWAPRSVRTRARRLEMAGALLEQRLGRVPLDDEVAEFLDVSLEEVRDNHVHTGSPKFLSLDALSVPGLGRSEESPVLSVEADVESRLEREELLTFLCNGLEKLPCKQYIVIALYYYENLVMREIADVLHLSEPAVSLRHTAALTRLRTALLRQYQLDEIRCGI